MVFLTFSVDLFRTVVQRFESRSQIPESWFELFRLFEDLENIETAVGVLFHNLLQDHIRVAVGIVRKRYRHRGEDDERDRLVEAIEALTVNTFRNRDDMSQHMLVSDIRGSLVFMYI